MTLRFVRAFAATPLLIACSEIPEAPDLGELRLIESAAWAGTEVLLVSSAPIGNIGRYSVSAGPFALSLRALDDSTIAALLPQMDGNVSFEVTVDGVPVLTAELLVAGYNSFIQGPRLTGIIEPMPGFGVPLVLAESDSTLVLVDLRTASIRLEIDEDSIYDTTCSLGPGPGNAAGTFVLRGRPAGYLYCGETVRAWRLGPTLMAVDSPPVPLSGSWMDAQIGPATWLHASENTTCTRTPTGSWCDWVSEPYGVRVSPGGEVAAILHHQGGQGALVLDVATGQPRYVVRAIRRTTMAVYSPDGDTLFLAGPDSADLRLIRLVAVRASSGNILTTAVPEDDFVAGEDIIADPFRPFLYMALTCQILVINRSTLETVTILSAPESDCARTPGWYDRLALSGAEGMLYAVAGGGTFGSAGATPAGIHRYRLP